MLNDDERDYAEEQYNAALMHEDDTPRCAECGDWIDYCQGHGDIYRQCPWCQSEDAEDYSPKLCRFHLAEYEGLSVDELDRRDREEAKDLL